jgi:TATA-binding protein-associated factor
MKKSLKGLDNFSVIKNFVQQKDVKQHENHKASQDEFHLSIKIKENLRYYQIAGIKWLSTLTSLGLGLALCDDMGLGKTIQTLCCIANETKIYQEKYGKNPISLIICPNTLILNWIKESKKFFDESEFKLKKFEGKFSSRSFLNCSSNSENNKNHLSSSFNDKNNSNKNSRESKIKNEGQINKIDFTEEENISKDTKNNLSKNYNKKPIEVFVTSYDKIRDMDEIPEEFFYVVLDEAHIIKNPKTKLYQNIKKISSERRIILTGTPIQNNVMELWSLFDFLMPGFLGTENDFEIKFHKKIYTNIKKLNLEEKLQENIFQSSLNDIRKRIKPFILRRLKQDVLKELPDKIIQDYMCEMTQVQKELYAYWEKIYSSLGVANKEDKAKENRKKPNNVKKGINKDAAAKAPSQPVLKIIDSMRKICNYPRLLLNTNNSSDAEAQKLLEKYKDKLNDFNCSGKLKALEDILVSFNFSSVNSEIINTAIINNNNSNNNMNLALNGSLNSNSNKLCENKILIFSQYKAMLQIIKNFLEANFKSLKVKILSSEINELQRFEIVNSFNSDPEINILLLTTSIGGLGLSLTAANIVIMYDHDWNPMRDLQAMDRAHRLGQKKTVEVFR